MEFEILHNPNFKPRKKSVHGIIIHAMSEIIQGKFANDFLYEIGLSAHYLIAPDGTVFQCVDPEDVAYHAGISEWNGEKYLNGSYIGIEVLVEGENEYGEFLEKIKRPGTFKPKQYKACRELINWLKQKYPGIENQQIVRHSEVSGASVRPEDPKYDPGSGFDMKKIKGTSRG